VSEGWAVTNEIMQKRPAVLRRWLEANAKALAYMQAHEEWSIKFLKKYFDEQDERIIKMVYDTFTKRTDPSGTMKPEWIKASLDLAASAGSEIKLAPEQIFSLEFTPIKVE